MKDVTRGHIHPSLLAMPISSTALVSAIDRKKINH
jgi:hypothetical protein